MLYKNYKSTYLGDSDIASLILAGLDEEGRLITKVLNFGIDGEYNAYICDDKAEIGGHYKEVARFHYWLRVYDDEGFMNRFRADEIIIYRAGDFGCIIQLKGERK